MEMSTNLRAAIRILARTNKEGGAQLINAGQAADLLSALPDELVAATTLPTEPGSKALLVGDVVEYRAILVRHHDGVDKWHDLADGQELRTDWVTSWEPLDYEVRPPAMTGAELRGAFPGDFATESSERLAAWINKRMGA